MSVRSLIAALVSFEFIFEATDAIQLKRSAELFTSSFKRQKVAGEYFRRIDLLFGLDVLIDTRSNNAVATKRFSLPDIKGYNGRSSYC